MLFILRRRMLKMSRVPSSNTPNRLYRTMGLISRNCCLTINNELADRAVDDSPLLGSPLSYMLRHILIGKSMEDYKEIIWPPA